MVAVGMFSIKRFSGFDVQCCVKGYTILQMILS